MRDVPPPRNEEIMRRQTSKITKPKMLEEYDFAGGVRGKYASLFSNGRNIVVLDPDVAEVFPDSESVNQALRMLTS